MNQNPSPITVSTPTKALLEIAWKHREDVSLLEKIVRILSERKNDYALEAYLKVGQLLERAKRLEKEEKTTARQLLDEYGRPLAHQWPDVECLAKTHGWVQKAGYFDDEGKGLMSYVGYHVGEHGQPRNIRRQILDCVFNNPLPNVQDEDYMAEWGEPKTRQRLRKMQDFLGYYSENPGRGDFRKAIEQWQEDLAYVTETYQDKTKLF